MEAQLTAELKTVVDSVDSLRVRAAFMPTNDVCGQLTELEKTMLTLKAKVGGGTGFDQSKKVQCLQEIEKEGRRGEEVERG